MKPNQFKKRGLYSVEEATLRAYEIVSDVFYINSLVKIVHNMLKPFRPMDSTVSRKLRILMKKGKVKYTANNEGVYSKII